MRLAFSFLLTDGAHTRTFTYDRVETLTIQDYVFNGCMNAEKALVINGTAYELRLVSDIDATVRKG